MVSATLVTSLFVGVVLTTKWHHGSATNVEIILDSDAYNRFDAPGEADGQTTRILIGALISHLSVDKVSKTAKVTMYFRQKWADARLAFVPANENVSEIRSVEREKIWLPDSFFTNVVELVQSDHYLLKWTKDGWVWYVQRLFATFPLSRVRLNENGEPVSDAHRVSMLLESFGYKMDTVQFEPIENPVEINTGLQPLGFNLTNALAEDCSMNYTSGAYSCLDLRIDLHELN